MQKLANCDTDTKFRILNEGKRSFIIRVFNILLAVRVSVVVTWKQWIIRCTGEVPYCLHAFD